MHRTTLLVSKGRAALAIVAMALPLAVACSSAETATTPDRAPAVRMASAFDIEAHKGKVVLVNFWATWCPPCQIETPALVELRNSFPADDVVIVGISVSEPGSRAQVVARLEKFVDEYGINYPVFYDEDQRLVREFYGSRRPEGVPSTLIIDRGGEIRHSHSGVPTDAAGRPIPLAVFAEDIQKLLDGA